MSESLPAYAELHCLSNFTFLRGASHPEELVLRAIQLGYSGLAITDECSLAGVVRAHAVAKEHSFKLIIGSEFRLGDGYTMVLLATDRESYGNLSQFITLARRRSEKGFYRAEWDDFPQHAAGCLTIFIPPAVPANWNKLLERTMWVRERFPGTAWIGVELLCGPDDFAQFDELLLLGEYTGLPLVATGNVHMHVRSRRPLQDTLTAIRLGTTVAEAGYGLYPNGERHLRKREYIASIFKHEKELLAETISISDRCQFSLDSLRYEYPDEVVPAGQTPASYLRALTENGLRVRFPSGPSPKVRKMVEHELALISELGYEPYFLTVYDIVKFAKDRGILCQGRGSAANSAVCYALGITEVDPARMSMLFERFISRERNEPPDIDVDFEHQRREEVIQYLYEKYGRDRAALTATVITYRTKSALRDVAKALGFDLNQVERLGQSLSWWDDQSTLPMRLTEAGFDATNHLVEMLILLVRTIKGFPATYRSIRVGLY